MRVNWRVAKNSKQPGQRGCCVPDGGACALVSSGALRSDSAAPASGHWKKTWGLSKFSNSEHWASSTAVFWRGNVLSMRGRSAAKGRPLLYWHSWLTRQPSAQRPPIMTKCIHTWSAMQVHVLYTERRHRGMSSFQHRIQHGRERTALVLRYIAHADISYRELDVCFHVYCTDAVHHLGHFSSGYQLQICTNSHLLVILGLLCRCCLLHLLDRQKQQNITHSVNWCSEISILCCLTGDECLLAPSPSGFWNALRLSLRPEGCLPVCTHTRLIWPGSLTGCQTHIWKTFTTIVFQAAATGKKHKTHSKTCATNNNYKQKLQSPWREIKAWGHNRQWLSSTNNHWIKSN